MRSICFWTWFRSQKSPSGELKKDSKNSWSLARLLVQVENTRQWIVAKPVPRSAKRTSELHTIQGKALVVFVGCTNCTAQQVTEGICWLPKSGSQFRSKTGLQHSPIARYRTIWTVAVQANNVDTERTKPKNPTSEA